MKLFCPECKTYLEENNTVFIDNFSNTICGCNHCVNIFYIKNISTQKNMCPCEFSYCPKKVYWLKKQNSLLGCQQCISEYKVFEFI